MCDSRLDFYRKEIKQIDRKILQLVKERIDFSKNIVKIKFDQDLPVRNSQVEMEVLNSCQELAKELKLNEELVLKLAKQLIDYSVFEQDQLYQKLSKRMRVFKKKNT